MNETFLSQLEDLIRSYMEHVVSKNAGETQRAETSQALHAGAHAMFVVLAGPLADQDEATCMVQMKQLQDFFVDYGRNAMQRRYGPRS